MRVEYHVLPESKEMVINNNNSNNKNDDAMSRKMEIKLKDFPMSKIRTTETTKWNIIFGLSLNL